MHRPAPPPHLHPLAPGGHRHTQAPPTCTGLRRVHTSTRSPLLMNVTVFGATGAIGSLTVAELLDRGHNVTAYARNATKVPTTSGDRIRVVIGEMSDAEAIDTAVAGADAVISALGP